jgi:hypothetical protein
MMNQSQTTTSLKKSTYQMRKQMKLSNKHKAAIKSYLRAVAASGITVLLAIVADIRPEFAILAGALVAPVVKALDPNSGNEADYGLNAK